MKQLLFPTLIFCLVHGSAATASGEESRPARGHVETTLFHDLEIADPAFPDDPPRQCRVVETLDAQGLPHGYSLSFGTPVCMDGKCRIVEVTMFWDALGHYQRLEYPLGQPLTKKEHEPFTPDDYAKLDRILSERDSIHGNVSLAFLVEHADASENASDEPDAWTGPTPVTMAESVVQDAAYTTWALWQWANGELSTKMAEITASQSTPEYLEHLLRQEDADHVDFALRLLAEQDQADRRLLDAMLHVLESGNRQQIAAVLAWLPRVLPDADARHARLVDALSRMRDDLGPMILEHLAAQPRLSTKTLEQLTRHLPEMPYYPVHLTLNLLDDRDCHSDVVLFQVARLLDHDNFFLARRAFEHLAKQTLPAELAAKVEAFQQQHADRL